MLMAGSDFVQPFYNTIPPAASKPMYHPSYDGMSATLAPSALDMSPRNVTNPPPMMSGANPDLSFQLPLDGAGGPYHSKSSSSSNGSRSGSGTGTPLEPSWEVFVNDSSWADNPVSS